MVYMYSVSSIFTAIAIARAAIAGVCDSLSHSHSFSLYRLSILHLFAAAKPDWQLVAVHRVLWRSSFSFFLFFFLRDVPFSLTFEDPSVEANRVTGSACLRIRMKNDPAKSFCSFG